MVAFFPPFTDEEKRNDDGGITEGLAHLRFALENIAKCWKNGDAELRLEVTRSVTLRNRGDVHHVRISTQWGRSVGAILVAPGRPARVVFASDGPSSLQWLGPEAVSDYFGAVACRSKQ